MQDPFNNLNIYNFRDVAYKATLLLGFLIIIYGVLWLLVKLGAIPAIFFAIFPQIVMILIGIFIIYIAYSRKNRY